MRRIGPVAGSSSTGVAAACLSPGGFALADQAVYLVASVWSWRSPLGLGKKPDRAE